MALFLDREDANRFRGGNALDDIVSGFQEQFNKIIAPPQAPAANVSQAASPTVPTGVPQLDSLTSEPTPTAPPVGTPAPQPSPVGPTNTSPADSTEAYIRQSAQARGIDPEIALRVYRSEGASAYVGDNGSSFGPYQLHYGNVASGGNAVGGLGDAFTAKTGLDARDPKTVNQQIDFTMDQVKQGGWTPWHGAAKAGVGQWDGVGQVNQQLAKDNPDWLSIAKSQLGKPYEWGSKGGRSDLGDNPSGFDCSGFVSWVYNKIGIKLPAQTESAYAATRAISADQAKPGDVVLYNMDNPDPHVQHIAIYAGNGQVIQAGGGQQANVNIAPIGTAGKYEFRRAGADGAGAPGARAGVASTINEALPDLQTGVPSGGPARGLSVDDIVGNFTKGFTDAFSGASQAAGKAKDDSLDHLGTTFHGILDGMFPTSGPAPSAPGNGFDPSHMQPAVAPAPDVPLRSTADLPPTQFTPGDTGVGKFAGAFASKLAEDQTQRQSDTMGQLLSLVPGANVPDFSGAVSAGLDAAGVPNADLPFGLKSNDTLGFAAGMMLPGGPTGKTGVASSAAKSVLMAGTKQAGERVLDDTLEMFARSANKPNIIQRTLTKLEDVPAWLENQVSDKLAPINRLGEMPEQVAALFQGRAGAAVLRAEEELTPAIQAVGKDLDFLNVYRKLQVDIERIAAKGSEDAARAPRTVAPPKWQVERAISLLQTGSRGGKSLGEGGPSQRDFTMALETLRDAGLDWAPYAKLRGVTLPAESAVVRELPSGVKSRAASAGVMTEADARQGLAALEARLGPERFAKVQQADQIVQGALDRLLDDKVASGMVKPELAAKLKEMYPHYNPVKLLEAVQDGTLGNTGKSLSQNGNLIRRLTEYGSESDTERPIQSAIRALVENDVAIKRNNAAKIIANAVESKGLGKRLPGQELITGPVVSSTLEPVGTVARGRTGDIRGYISYMEKGREVHVSVPEDIERAVKAMDDQTMGVWSKMASLANAPVRAGATTLNVAFIPKNAVSDAVQTFIREGWDATKRIPAGYLHAARNDDVAKAFTRAGGAQEGFFTRNPADIQKAIEQAGGTLIRGKKDWLRFLNPLTPVKRFGEIVEAGPRLATFESRLAKGQTAGQAALAGRRVTVDFARSGQAIKQANSWVAFLNAQVQGTLQVGRTLRDVPGSRVRLAGLSALVASTYAWNRQFGEEWSDIPDYVKDQNAILILGHGEKDPSGVGFKSIPYVAIPLRQWALPAAALQHAIANAEGNDPRAWDDFAKQNALNFQPISADSAAAGVGGLIPAPARAALEAQMNVRFYSGLPIVSKKYEGTSPSEQYDERTGRLTKAVADRIGASPKGLDFVLSEVTGGLGRQIGAADFNPTTGLVKTQGGQIEQNKYNQMSDIITANAGRVSEQVQSSRPYQAGTRDRQLSLDKAARAELTNNAKEAVGLPKSQTDTGLPPKYIGVTDHVLEGQIDAALSRYRAWLADPHNNRRPDAEQMSLARKYENRVNPRYTRATGIQQKENALVRGYSALPKPAQ